MRSVRLNFLSMFFLVFSFSYQGYADCPPFVESNTELEAGGKKVLEGFLKIISLGTAGSFKVDEKLYKYITVKQVKDQGIDGYFNPRIKVCDYEGENNCYILPSGTSCRQIYGTQSTGGGVSTAVFIDWEGDKTKTGREIAQGLEWEWAEGVIESSTSDEEKKMLAKLPKICACSQKGACMSGISSWGAKAFSGANIFRPGEMENVCDTCSWGQGKQKIKCAPVPLAPGPPPFCDQLAMSPPRVRIVPITNEDNDYFDPKVKVIAGDLIEEDGKIGKKLGFPRKYGENEAEWRPIADKDGTTHYFKTYRKKDQLCVEYRGTEREESKRKLQFPARCFPTPPAPEPEVVEIVQSNTPRKQSDTLKIRMKMNRETCNSLNDRAYSDGFCTFSVNTGSPTNVGPLSLKVVQPAIVAKAANSSKSNINDIIEGILESNPQFKILREYGCVPNIETECKASDAQGKCKLDNLGRPEIEARYDENSKSKMLCLSGWQPEPEEFVIEREGKIIPLKLMGASYAKYNAVYSKESNQFYYLPSKDNTKDDLLKRPQKRLDGMMFNKQGYIFFPDENKQEKGKCSYCVKKNDEINKTFASGTGLKVVYKLVDGKREEKSCNQGDDGCICFNGTCSRSTRYVDKENTQSFYTKISQDANGVVTQQEAPIKANRTEVFYADKLCRFDLEGLKNRLREIIIAQLKDKKQKLEKKNQKPYDLGDGYTDDLSIYDYVEIEAWGGGEAGHIKNTPSGCKDTNCSPESRPGMPGDYIKVQLKIDPEYPIIRAQATEGGGGLTSHISNKDGGPTFIKMCKDSSGVNCKDLITVAGGGIHKKYGDREYRETKVHDNLGNLKLLGNPTIVTGTAPIQDNQMAYVENGEIKHKAAQCSNANSDKYGAGGCIDKSRGTYGRGSPGYVIIKSVQVDDKEVEKIINAFVDLKSNGTVNNLIEELYPGITEEIKEEIKKELLDRGQKILNYSPEN